MSEAANPSTNPTAPEPATDRKGRRKKTKVKRDGAIRYHVLEPFGTAILAAVLLKWFCIEAFMIPTSSMQPTMMGSSEAGVHDRPLVDKFRYLLCDPQRWDIAVFRYPLQKNQNYVKRIVGLPGERIHIAGGNLYLVEEKEGKRTYTAIRKPERIQEVMWREVFPARALVRGEQKMIGGSLYAVPQAAWSETDDGLTAALRPNSTCRLNFEDTVDGGMVDQVWDGYASTKVAKIIRDQTRIRNEIVPDVKIAFAPTLTGKLQELVLQVDVTRTQLEQLTFGLVIVDGKGRLFVRRAGKEVAASEPFDFPVDGREIGFAHLDDELIAWHDGREVGGRLDTSAHHCRDGCEKLPDEKPDARRVLPQILCKGDGTLAIGELRIWRDQHYTRGAALDDKALPVDNLIEIPAGNYFMMGDNTRQSVDAREWTALRIGVMPDGEVVPEDTPGSRLVRGNLRTHAPGSDIVNDETPVVFPERKELMMIDEFGEVLRLRSGISPSYDQDHPIFERLGSVDGTGTWTAKTEHVMFVPREHIVGRALFNFYPSRPLSWLTFSNWPDRAGFIR